MSRVQLNYDYFRWLLRFVYANRGNSGSYRELLGYLHERDFYWSVTLDDNRAVDGIDLRTRYVNEKATRTYPDIGECSVLEMMVALAIRCEKDVMGMDEYGDRTSQWFWEMIMNLGLSDQIDERYDNRKVSRAITRMLNRTYTAKGKGGLFYVKNPRTDLRRVDIWMQMNWHFEEELREQGFFDITGGLKPEDF